MASAITTSRSEVRRSLSTIAAEIKLLFKEAAAAAEAAKQPYHNQIGDLLVEAKKQFEDEGKPVAEFLSWVHRHFGLKQTQTYDLLSIGKDRQIHFAATKKPPSYPSIKAHLRSLGRDRPTTAGGLHAPEWKGQVEDNIERARKEAERFEAVERTRKEEREAIQKLAARIVDIGYRVLAKELHPDKKGGSKEAFGRLKEAHELLKRCIGG